MQAEAIDFADPVLLAKLAHLFPDDTPLPGGEERLAELRAKSARENVDYSLYNETGHKTAYARHLVVIGREYRRVLMGMTDA